MLPYITIFNKQIPSYGLAVLLGFLLSLVYFTRIMRKKKALQADAELAFIYGAVGAFVGAKLLYILTVLPEFIAQLPYLFSETELFLQKYLSGGLVFYGGLYGALAAVWLYCRAARLSFSDMVGRLLPVFTLIHAFGRVGCFCVGCCYGCVSERFGIAFVNSQIAPNGVPLLPVQLYEAGFELLLFALLAVRAFRERNGICSVGLYFLLYGSLRFVLEFWRGDAIRGFIGTLSTSQVISVVTIAGGCLILLIRYRQARRNVAKGTESTTE